jgi:hypothetical protein
MGRLALTLLLLTATAAPAGAVVCAKGVYRAGCAGPHGAVVAPRNYGAAVVHPYARPVAARPYGVACRWVNGVRVCR